MTFTLRDKIINRIILASIALISMTLLAFWGYMTSALTDGPVLYILYRVAIVIFWIIIDVRLIVLWYRRHTEFSKSLIRIDKGKASTIRAKYEARWSKGNRSPVTSFVLTRAYIALSEWGLAQEYAGYTLDGLAQQGDFLKTDRHVEWLCLGAALNLYNAYYGQRQYLEAARYMRAYPRFEELHSSFYVLTAWAYHLSEGYDDAARVTLALVRPSDIASFPPTTVIQYAYLGYKLLNDDPILILQQHQYLIDHMAQPFDPMWVFYFRNLDQVREEIRGLLQNSVTK